MIEPKAYFVTSGKGESSISKMNAFDRALISANLAHYNLVPVSSILPEGAVRLANLDQKPGSILFCVLSHMEGERGESLATGIGWTFGSSENGRYGLIAETHGNKDRETIKRELKEKLRDMANARKMTLGRMLFRIEDMKVSSAYGSVVVAMILL